MDRVKLTEALTKYLPPEHHAQVEPFAVVFDDLRHKRISPQVAQQRLAEPAFAGLLAAFTARTVALPEGHTLEVGTTIFGDTGVVQQIRLLGGLVAGDVVGELIKIEVYSAYSPEMAAIERQRSSLEQWIVRTVAAHELTYSADHHRLAALIMACQSWNSTVTPELPADLNLLLERLHPHNDMTQPWRDLCDYIDAVLPQGTIARYLTYPLIRNALALHLRDLDISWLYGRHRPPGALWEQRGRDVTSLTPLIRILAQADPVGKRHPLVDCAWWLAQEGERQQSAQAVVQAVRDWARTMASLLGLDIPTDKRQTKDAPHEQRLQLRLAPVPTATTDQPRYYLDAWLRSAEHWVPVCHHKEVSPDTIQEALDVLLKQLGPRLRRSPESIVEVFLPHRLLLLDVDRWPLSGTIQAPLGVDYRVIVRSFERSDTSGWEFWDRWRYKWRLLTTTQAVGNFTWVSGPDAIPSLIRFYGQLQEDACAGVVQTWIPEHHAQHASPPVRFEQMVKHIVAAGLVAALFVRPCQHTPDTARACLEPLLATRSPRHLLDLVRSQRLTAGDDHLHLGSHLTLMWDPPELVPPDVQDIFEESESA